MDLYFILHDWTTNQEILIELNEYRHEGALGSPGTTVWWRDGQGNSRSAFVKESPEEINEIMRNLKSLQSK